MISDFVSSAKVHVWFEFGVVNKILNEQLLCFMVLFHSFWSYPLELKSHWSTVFYTKTPKRNSPIFLSGVRG